MPIFEAITPIGHLSFGKKLAPFDKNEGQECRPEAVGIGQPSIKILSQKL